MIVYFGLLLLFVTWNHIIVSKLLVSDGNTWNYETVCKLFVLSWNTWHNRIVCKLFY